MSKYSKQKFKIESPKTVTVTYLRPMYWCRGVVVITTAQSHSTKPELRFSAGSNPFCGVWEIRNGEDLWQSSRLDIRLNSFCRSTVPHKQIIVNNLGFANVK